MVIYEKETLKSRGEMDYKTTNPFEKYFHFERAKVDVGLLKMEEAERHAVAKAYFDFSYVIDVKHGRLVEVVSLKEPRSVVLPRSVRNRTKIVCAGEEPVFAVLDTNYNLITYMVLGCALRVEYLGKKGESKKVKYFTCW